MGGIVNTLRPRQNGRHFPDDIFKCIFLNENIWISIKISLKFVPKGPINNNPALVQIMAWRRLGGKPLSEPMMVSFLTHICVTRPQWVNKPYYIRIMTHFSDVGVRHKFQSVSRVNIVGGVYKYHLRTHTCMIVLLQTAKIQKTMFNSYWICFARWRCTFRTSSSKYLINLAPLIWIKSTAGHEIVHDDVIVWKRFSHYWPFVRGTHPWSVDSLYKGQYCRAVIFPLLLACL